jgi:transcriptional regulator with PAS, ATPase and Fis domain
LILWRRRGRLVGVEELAIQVRWEGTPPSPRLAAALARAGVELGGGPDAVVVVHGGEPEPPPGCARGWLWLCPGRVAQARRVRAVELGAYDVVEDGEGAELVGRRLRELDAVTADPPPPTCAFIARSPAAVAALRQVARAARTSMPVLLVGETGTGKDVVAHLLHEWSSRRGHRFVAINCAAIPNDLMESELFGYVRGAFTGASQSYDGQLMAAAGGTVFLDEIDDTPLHIQMKLLRVLEDRVVSRLGENLWHRVDFRIVAATNRDLRQLIERGEFGGDLYERLAILTVALPPLRQRTADLLPLGEHFIRRFYDEEGAPPRVGSISAPALAALEVYPWPGNVRELRNVIFETLAYKRAGDEILLGDLPRRLLKAEGSTAAARPPVAADDPGALMDQGRYNLRRALEDLERQAVTLALQKSGGNAARAARLLGEVGRGQAGDPGATVRAIMRRLGVATPRGEPPRGPPSRGPGDRPPTRRAAARRAR